MPHVRLETSGNPCRIGRGSTGIGRRTFWRVARLGTTRPDEILNTKVVAHNWPGNSPACAGRTSLTIRQEILEGVEAERQHQLVRRQIRRVVSGGNCTDNGGQRYVGLAIVDVAVAKVNR